MIGFFAVLYVVTFVVNAVADVYFRRRLRRELERARCSAAAWRETAYTIAAALDAERQSRLN